MNSNSKNEPEGMDIFEFLYEISYRPPSIIFIILGFILIVWGWPNLYVAPLNSIHFGNFGVGIIGAILVLSAIFIELKVRSGKWKPESMPKD